MNESVMSEPDFGTGKKKFNVYVIGLVLCLVLTLIAFWAVMPPKYSPTITFSLIFIAAILQFLVQVVCFLRLNAATEQSRINLMSFLFTVVVLVAVVAGSLWIMWSLSYNMMH